MKIKIEYPKLITAKLYNGDVRTRRNFSVGIDYRSLTFKHVQSVAHYLHIGFLVFTVYIQWGSEK